MGDESTFQPFDRTGLLRRAAPFVGAMWLALVIYPLPPHGGDSDAFVTAVALNVIILVSVLIVPWRRLGPMAGGLSAARVPARHRPPARGRRRRLLVLRRAPDAADLLARPLRQPAAARNRLRGPRGRVRRARLPDRRSGVPVQRVDARAGVAVRRADHRVHGAVARARAAEAAPRRTCAAPKSCRSARRRPASSSSAWPRSRRRPARWPGRLTPMKPAGSSARPPARSRARASPSSWSAALTESS